MSHGICTHDKKYQSVRLSIHRGVVSGDVLKRTHFELGLRECTVEGWTATVLTLRTVSGRFQSAGGNSTICGNLHSFTHHQYATICHM